MRFPKDCKNEILFEDSVNKEESELKDIVEEVVHKTEMFFMGISEEFLES